jgi:hypothetical protein
MMTSSGGFSYGLEMQRKIRDKKRIKSGKKACQWGGDLVECCTAFSPGGIQVPHELPGRGLGGSASTINLQTSL